MSKATDSVLSGESRWCVEHGSCLDIMRTMPENSVDSIVTDPPAGISFMQRSWDSSKGGRNEWILWLSEIMTESIRVLRPGAHGLVWAMPRTSHWTGMALENAGFNIKDTLHHSFGSGFPKSLNVSKNIDRCLCALRGESSGDAAELDQEVLLKGLLEQGQIWKQEQDVSVVRSRLGCEEPHSGPEESYVLKRVRNEKGKLSQGEGEEEGEERTREEVPNVRDNVQALHHEVLQPSLLGANKGLSHESDMSPIAPELDGCNYTVGEGEDDGCGEPCVARRSDLLAQPRELQAGEVCEMSSADSDGAQGRLRDGAPAVHGQENGTNIGLAGGCPSHRPRSAEQSFGEPGIVAGQRKPQEGGAWDICGGCGKPIIPDGIGTALKPGHEIWWLVQKPLSGTYSDNVERYRTGGINVDACRIAHASPEDFAAHEAQVNAIKARGGSMEDSWKNSSDLSGASDVSAKGRWPANLLLQHSASCERIGTVSVKANPTWDTPNREAESAFTGKKVSKVRHAETSKDFHMQQGAPILEESVPQWRCDNSCPVKLMDRQNEEGASRFFAQFELEDLDLDPFIYCAKPSRAERDFGMEGFAEVSGGDATGRKDGSAGVNNPRAGAGRTGGSRNIHPTIKSLQLMRYLCKLVTPKNGIVLDPFTGSGSGGMAALLEGFRFVGCELNNSEIEPFVDIARARIGHVASGEYHRQSAQKKLPADVKRPGQQSMF